jgi:periplasmic protein TonB
MSCDFRVRCRRPLLAALLPAISVGCSPSEPSLDSPPRQVSESPFHYPDHLWDRDIEGKTTLKVLINTEGQVDSAVIEASSGYSAFDSAALTGAHQLRFEPARRGEKAVALWVLLPVHFDKVNSAANQEEQP